MRCRYILYVIYRGRVQRLRAECKGFEIRAWCIDRARSVGGENKAAMFVLFESSWNNKVLYAREVEARLTDHHMHISNADKRETPTSSILLLVREILAGAVVTLFVVKP